MGEMTNNSQANLPEYDFEWIDELDTCNPTPAIDQDRRNPIDCN